MLAGLYEDMNNLSCHGRVQVTSARGGMLSTLTGVKETIFSPLQLECNLSSFFVECRAVQESFGELEDVLAHRDPVAPLALRDWHNVHLNNLVVRGAAPIGKFHVCPPIRQPS
jgi:hypothetical protein